MSQLADLEKICALATPPGRSAIAVIRATGKGTIEAVEQLFRSQGSRNIHQNPRSALFGRFVFENETLDEILLLTFPAPRSYTGEDMVEIQCHGNPVIIEKILSALFQSGFRPARPGEFTNRAYVNSKMDLLDAQAVLDIIESRTEEELQSALRVKSGEFRKLLYAFRSALIGLMADLTAELDFIEEDIQFVTIEEKLQMLDALSADLIHLIDFSKTHERLRKGVEIVIVGPPNAGKSTLLNYLLGEKRAIVSPVPGTTRDFVDGELTIEGIRVHFVDTAGLRETNDEIEKQGIAISREKSGIADLLLFVFDQSVSWKETDLALFSFPASMPAFTILNKDDLRHPDWDTAISHPFFADRDRIFRVSLTNGSGAEEMRSQLIHFLKSLNTHGSSILLSAWQLEIFEKIHSLLHVSSHLIRAQESPEIIVATIQEAIDAFGELTGEIDSEQILGRIFSKFCIGK